jgi:hypothetical protein
MLRDFVHILITWESDDDVPILNLSGGPFVSYGRHRVAVPEGSKRLLVFVALHRDRVERRYAAGNLRSALWRLNGFGCPAAENGQAWLCDV